MTQAASAQAAAAQNATQTESMVTALRRSLGNSAEIRTSGYSLTPNFRYAKDGGQPELSGYTASNTVAIVTNDLASVGKVIDAGTQAGANNVRGLEFQLKDEAPVRAQGLIYELTPGAGGAWEFSILHNFTGKPDGATPYGTPILDSAGNLYGTTYSGGASNKGTVYVVSPAPGGGWTERVIHSFRGGSDGVNPMTPLTFDPKGNLYGTTSIENPNGLIFDTHGNLYGTSMGGGVDNPGPSLKSLRRITARGRKLSCIASLRDWMARTLWRV